MKSLPLLTVANFRTLHVHKRVRQPRDTNFMFLAFDLLLHQEGIDLKVLPLSERKPDLARLCNKGSYPSSA
jgi:ATP-dependent DNA ligase